jgi:hypothetical protein
MAEGGGPLQTVGGCEHRVDHDIHKACTPRQ